MKYKSILLCAVLLLAGCSGSDNLAVVMIGKKWGFINKEGKYVINPRFDLAGDFQE